MAAAAPRSGVYMAVPELRRTRRASGFAERALRGPEGAAPIPGLDRATGPTTWGPLAHGSPAVCGFRGREAAAPVRVGGCEARDDPAARFGTGAVLRRG